MKAHHLGINLSIFFVVSLISSCGLITSMTENPTLTPSVTAAMITPELPTRTHTPAPTATKPLPTFTPTSAPPTSTPTPMPIEGIDVPIVIKNVSLKNSLGLTETVDIEMKILDVITRERMKSGEETVLPEEEGDIFLSLRLSLEESTDAIRWVVPNVTVLCGDESHQARKTVTIEFGKGLLQSWQVHYEVPADASFGSCSVQLPDGREIPLDSFFSETEGGATPGGPNETPPPGEPVILLANPDCPAPEIASADEIIVRLRWGATTKQLAESNSDHFTFEFLLDGKDQGDIRSFRQPSEVYSSLERYDCGTGEPLAWVHWDIPIGRLPAGTHTISINYILDQAISDGMDDYPAGPFGFLEVGFDVLP